MKIKQPEQAASPYISPKDIPTRWDCSRPSVDRIAQRAGMQRHCLGEGKNGMIRSLRKEVEAYELDRTI